MLKLLLLGSCGDAGEGLDALVDLQCVRGDRHRALSTLAQAARERHRHGGLADAGRSEQGDHM